MSVESHLVCNGCGGETRFHGSIKCVKTTESLRSQAAKDGWTTFDLFGDPKHGTGDFCRNCVEKRRAMQAKLNPGSTYQLPGELRPVFLMSIAQGPEFGPGAYGPMAIFMPLADGPVGVRYMPASEFRRAIGGNP